MEHNRVILSTAYFAPIQYYSKLSLYSHIIIENCETYPKQSYRNRCYILSSNGPLPLSIPVDKGISGKRTISDITIDYSSRWQSIHLHALKSAYRNSAYFDYYIDELMCFFLNKEKYLIDLNTNILEKTMEIVGMQRNLEFSGTYRKQWSVCDDFRNSIHPKPQYNSIDKQFCAKPYYQVFGERQYFAPNMSILDLIFNEGPLSLQIIRDCSRHNV